MEEMGYSLSQQSLRLLIRVLGALEDVVRHFKGMDDLAKIVRFASSNTKMWLHEDNRKLWSRVDLKDTFEIDAVTRDVATLIWLALSLGRAINQYRKLKGMRPVNWEKRAKEIDEMERKAQDANTPV